MEREFAEHLGSKHAVKINVKSLTGEFFAKILLLWIRLAPFRFQSDVGNAFSPDVTATFPPPPESPSLERNQIDRIAGPESFFHFGIDGQEESVPKRPGWTNQERTRWAVAIVTLKIV